MKAFIALMFCSQSDLRTYAPEVLAAIQGVAGSDFKRAESAAGVTAIGFRSDKEAGVIATAFRDLWRPEQRTWVVALDDAVLVDRSLADWARKA